MENIPPPHNKLLTGWKRRPRAEMLIPRPSSGEANANGGVTEHEIDDMLWVAVELTVADHFAVSALVLNKGQGRDKWPTRKTAPYLAFPSTLCKWTSSCQVGAN